MTRRGTFLFKFGDASRIILVSANSRLRVRSDIMKHSVTVSS